MRRHRASFTRILILRSKGPVCARADGHWTEGPPAQGFSPSALPISLAVSIFMRLSSRRFEGDSLQPGRRGLERSVPSGHPLGLHFASVGLIAAGREKRVEPLAAEAEVRDLPVRRGE